MQLCDFLIYLSLIYLYPLYTPLAFYFGLLYIAKLRLKLKKARKNNSPAKYDLSQIPYEFTVVITNRFKGLDLVNSVPEDLWTEVCNIVQEVANKTTPKKNKKVKWLSEEALQIAGE